MGNCTVFHIRGKDIGTCGKPELIRNCCEEHAIPCVKCGKPCHPYVEICIECKNKDDMMVADIYKAKFEPIQDYGDLFTIDDFVENCRVGAFIDNDGSGYYAYADKVSDIPIWPSRILKNTDIRFTHVVWFNK